jgi:hypothetical protein
MIEAVQSVSTVRFVPRAASSHTIRYRERCGCG